MNNLKNALKLLVLTLVITMTSCSTTTETETIEVKPLKNTWMNVEMFSRIKKYIKTTDNSLELGITRREAQRLGITVEFYDSLQANLRRGNKLIEESEKTGTTKMAAHELNSDSDVLARMTHRPV